jgi:hypothetical protein
MLLGSAGNVVVDVALRSAWVLDALTLKKASQIGWLVLVLVALYNSSKKFI